MVPISPAVDGADCMAASNIAGQTISISTSGQGGSIY